MHGRLWSRRSFLKASLVGAFILFSQPAFPRELMPERLSEGRLALYNIHTEERLKIKYRDRYGKYDPEALRELNYFFRCHYTQKVKKMDLRVIEFLNTVDKKLRGDREICIVSGYRSPEYNNLLIRRGRGAVKKSLHLLGRAIDMYIPTVRLTELRRTAVTLGYGGVGYYPKSGFVHIDSGRFRTW